MEECARSYRHERGPSGMLYNAYRCYNLGHTIAHLLHSFLKRFVNTTNNVKVKL